MDITFNNNGSDLDITLSDDHIEITKFTMFEFGTPNNLMYGLSFEIISHESQTNQNTAKVIDFQILEDAPTNFDTIVENSFVGRVEHGRPNGQISRPPGDKGKPIVVALTK